MTNQRGFDEIWQDDRFDRREDAIAIQAFIESVWDREKALPQGRAYTLAIDATYGVGKTFFLKRLEEHLSLNHPVAYVDAWRDDLADDPLVALLATLKAALKNYISEGKPAASKWKAVARNAGTIVGIAGKGLLRRAAIAVATGGAVNEIDELLDGASEEVVNATKEAAKDAVEGVADDLKSAVELIQSGSTLDRRINEFDAGTKAIAELKDSLRELVRSLDNAPIVVIVDELDRCRPNYAVKLLEEVKHLFDVQGLVFIFGLHGDQLAKSIRAEYGEGFDGEHYLRRFINRTYHLPDPDLSPLVVQFLADHGLEERHFFETRAVINDQEIIQLNAPVIITKYLNSYRLTARDALSFLDALEICVATSRGIPILLPSLLPKLFSNLNLSRNSLIPELNYSLDVALLISGNRNGIGLHSMISHVEQSYDECINANDAIMMDLVNKNYHLAHLYYQFSLTHLKDIDLHEPFHPKNYRKLVKIVGRFQRPRKAILAPEVVADLGVAAATDFDINAS